MNPRTRRRMVPPRPQSAEMSRLDFRGLNLSAPYDAMDENKSPFGKNFRVYAEDEDDRRVAISSRKGSGFYTNPLGETLDVQNADTTPTNDAPLGVITDWKAQSFVPTVTGSLTKVELMIKYGVNPEGPLVIQIHANNAGIPGKIIADSGILGSSINQGVYTYTAAQFIEAPAVVSGTTYWITAHIQDNGTGQYLWRNVTTASGGLSSGTAGTSWDPLGGGLNYKTYITPAATIKGLARFAPPTAVNKTLVAIGTDMYTVNDVTGAHTSIASGLNVNATFYDFTFADGKVFWVNGFDGLKAWDGTTLETITHPLLATLKLAQFHKDILWGVTVDDPNKLIYSVLPNQVDNNTDNRAWYRGWRSVNFQYVPYPKASDPITAIIPFQDTLITFGGSFKYQVYGNDVSSVVARQAIGNKGAYNQKGVMADENFVYFASDDGFYRFNGSNDELISELVQTEIAKIADMSKVVVSKWKRQIRFYYPTSGSSVNNRCLIYHTVLKEWTLDTDTYVTQVLAWKDRDDPKELVEASSVAPRLTYAERDYNNLGKAIDFEYHCKPDSMKNPAKRKRIVKLFPLLQAEGADYSVQVGVDKDLKDAPVFEDILMDTGGAEIGEFFIGDGTDIGGDTAFSPKRLRTSGYAYYWQLIIKRKGINNPVNFLGYIMTFRAKRL